MLCEFFRHIDLEDTYKNLKEDTFFDLNVSNIPEPFRETLTHLLEVIAEAAFDPNDHWTEHAAIDVGAEVGDMIESDIYKITMEADVASPDLSDSPLEAVHTLRVMCTHTAALDYDYWSKISLSLYQYDLLCWLHKLGETDHLLEVYELILRTYGEIQISESSHVSSVIQKRKISNTARERANRRHAPTNQKKAELLEEWARTFAEYKSRADFCRIISQREGMKERTLQEWIQAYERGRV